MVDLPVVAPSANSAFANQTVFVDCATYSCILVTDALHTLARLVPMTTGGADPIHYEANLVGENVRLYGGCHKEPQLAECITA